MGYQQGTQCFATVEQAADYAGAQMTGQVVSTGNGGPWAISYEGFNGSQLRYALHAPSSAVTLQVPYQAVPCQLVDMDDAAEMAWLVVGAWAAAYGVRLAANALKG
ncbi:MAG: hypothetical protein Q4B17_08255 [Lautropia sp.]|nr:hypothetical protein [Lautropia sp.]